MAMPEKEPTRAMLVDLLAQAAEPETPPGVPQLLVLMLALADAEWEREEYRARFKAEPPEPA